MACAQDGDRATACLRPLQPVREHLQRAQSLGLIATSEADLLTGTHHWSQEYYDILDLDPVTTTPSTSAFVDAVHPDDRPRLVPFDALVARQDPVAPIELRIQRRDGEVRWIHRHAGIVRGPGGTPTRVLFAIQDITERKRLEAALLLSERELKRCREHLLQTQNVTQTGSAEVDLRSGAVYWSQELYRILGLAPAAKPSLDLFLSAVHPDDREAVRSWSQAIRAGTAAQPIAFRIVRSGGEIRWIRVVGEFAGDAGGLAARLLSTMIDVTEAREAEEERVRLRHQAAHAQKLDSLGALAGGVAHDFNNLLTAILGNATLLRDDGELPAEARALADAVVRAAEHGAGLTRRLLSFGRRPVLPPIALDPAVVARDLAALLDRTLGEHIDIRYRAEPGLWRIRADRSLLEAALINLAVNARDAMPDGGTLDIEMTNRSFSRPEEAARMNIACGDYVVIAVRDTGSGMAPEVLARAAEPFFTTKREGHGTGLGLAMVQGFAKQSDGCVTIESEPGAGTRVAIFLPRSQAKVSAPRRRAAPRRPVGGSESVLLVEDDELVRQFVATALRRLGYRVAAVADGRAALALLRDPAVAVDLLLTDLILPGGMSGRDIAAVAAQLRPGLPALFTSGHAEDALIRNGQLDPGQTLIVKPFSADSLALSVRAALGGVTPRPLAP